MPEARILIVEDEAVEAMDIQHRLVRLGYPRPDIAYSGEEGVTIAAQTQPDLVLMDIMMPGNMDGVAAAEHIRSRFDIPIIFLTAYADEDTLRRAKITAPYGYLVKPFQERELHITADMALFRHQMERERKKNEEHRERLILELESALARLKTLSGLLPICAQCKKIRDDAGYWHQVECYLSEHTAARFTHGMCPECGDKALKDLAEWRQE